MRKGQTGASKVERSASVSSCWLNLSVPSAATFTISGIAARTSAPLIGRAFLALALALALSLSHMLPCILKVKNLLI